MTSKQIDQQEAVAMAAVLELLAGIKRDVEVLLHMAKKKSTTTEDIHEQSLGLFDKTYTLELALLPNQEEEWP